MRRGLRTGAALGCLLAFLLLPNLVSAHQITDVQVDCPGKAIVVSGNGFGAAGSGPITLTVTGPEGYLESAMVPAVIAWTVSLPLGPSGEYAIEWPDSGDSAVTFSVDCPAATASPSPTPAQTPTRTHPSKSPEHEVTTPRPQKTLPPTDTTTLSSPSPVSSDTALATLLLIGVFAASVAVRRTAYRRTWRR